MATLSIRFGTSRTRQVCRIDAYCPRPATASRPVCRTLPALPGKGWGGSHGAASVRFVSRATSVSHEPLCPQTTGTPANAPRAARSRGTHANGLTTSLFAQRTCNFSSNAFRQKWRQGVFERRRLPRTTDKGPRTNTTNFSRTVAGAFKSAACPASRPAYQNWQSRWPAGTLLLFLCHLMNKTAEPLCSLTRPPSPPRSAACLVPGRMMRRNSMSFLAERRRQRQVHRREIAG